MALSAEQVNEQAASIAASVLNDSVIAAARCEQITQTMQLEAAGVGGATRGMAKFGSKLGRSMMPSVGKMAEGLRGAGLPDSFVLAVTTSQVHALEEKEKKGQLVPGAILRSWDREGLLASRGNDATAAMAVIPEDRQVLVLYLPLDGAQSKYLAAAARQMAAAGSPGKPTKFMIAKDPASQAVLEELVRTSPVHGPS